MPLGRVLIAWLLLIAAETCHGILRGLLLSPFVGDLRARQIGVAVGSALVFGVALVTVRWIGRRTLAQWLTAGVVWLVLTVAFEVALGRALGYSSSRILADYDPSRGGYMALGLIVLALAPAAAARIRGVLLA